MQAKNKQNNKKPLSNSLQDMTLHMIKLTYNS